MGIKGILKITFNLFFFFFFISIRGFSQQRQVENQPKYDKQVFHPGFALGLNYSNFRVQLVDDFRIRDTVYTVTAEKVTGLNLGIIGDIRVGEYFNLRLIPSLSFAQRNLIYHLTYTDNLY
jgi:hypothetical protein